MKQEKAVDIALLHYYKDLYGGHKIIYVRFCDTDFIFRTLTRKEYRYILAENSDRMDIEDAICNTACVFPEEYDFCYCGFAGLNEYVAQHIEKYSGFIDINDILDEYRKFKAYDNLDTQCMDLIKAFIPEYTYEEMETWTWTKLMQIVVRAEKVAALKGFDWHVEDKSEEFNEAVSKIDIENEEYIQELIKNGIDPMFYFADNLQDLNHRTLVDFPLIGGVHWNDEEVLDAIRQQIAAKNANREL